MSHAIKIFHPLVAAQKSLDKDTVLYHTFQYDYFEKMLMAKKLYFRRVVKWADTYEYPIRFMPEDRRESIEESLFGFCLTKKYDKEVMWKLYSGEDNRGICIKTTASAICQALAGITRSSLGPTNNVFIGNVRYVSYLENRPDLMFNEDIKSEYPDYMYPAFIKRDAFDYEEEVRLLVHDLDAKLSNPENGLWKDLSSMDFIQEIILSPYYPEDKIDEVEALCHKNGLSVPIHKSDFLKKIAENSVPLPEESKVYWDQPEGAYDISSL